MDAGTSLGHYRIIGTLGRGGMGEVFSAEDTRLKRRVALKVLPDGFANDPERLERFRREAEALAAVNHPNIVAIHSIEESQGRQFLTMELVDGAPLSTRIQPGGLPVPTVIEWSTQICDAIISAHSRGVIHRDLKPANVMITLENRVKLLDFGLSKRFHECSPSATTQLAAAPLTEQGGFLGTVGYLSPEQAEGGVVDHRSDVFSLGVVLYEMATGVRPFSGPSTLSVLSSILKETPRRVSEVRPGVSEELSAVVERCLAKRPQDRYQSAAAVRDALKVAHSTDRLPISVISTRIEGSIASRALGIVRRRPMTAGVVSLLTVTTIFAIGLWFRSKASATETVPFSDPHMQRVTLSGDVLFAAISADGRFCAYVRRNNGVWVRQLSAPSDVLVAPFVEGRTYDSVTLTPDGESVDFAVAEAGTRDLWRVPLLGGTPRKIVSDIWSAPGWSSDGRSMAFLRTNGPTGSTSLIVSDRDGRNERVITTRHNPRHDYLNISWQALGTNRPSWSPDGRRLILAGAPGDSIQASELVIVDVLGRSEERVVPMWSEGLVMQVAWLDATHVLLTASETLSRAQALWRLDLESGDRVALTRDLASFGMVSLTADRRTILATRTERRSGIWLGNAGGDQVGRFVVRESAAGAASPALDGQGGLVYQALSEAGVATVYALSDGAMRPSVIGEAGTGGFAVTRDGSFVVVSSTPAGALERFNHDGTGRLTLVPNNAGGPTLSADGRSVFFSPFGSPGLFSVSIEGGPVEQVTNRFVGTIASLSPDGTRLLFGGEKPGSVVVCTLPRCADQQQLRLKSAQWAPDGRGVAYVKEEDRRNLWEQPLDGSPEFPLTRLADANVLEFAWAPDWKRLAMARGHIADDVVLLRVIR